MISQHAPGPDDADHPVLAAQPTRPGTPDQPATAPSPRPAGGQHALRGRTRRVLAAVLAAAFAVLMPAVTSAWIRGTVLSTSGYVVAITPVAANPAVRAAVQETVASEVDAVLNHAGGALPGPLNGTVSARSWPVPPSSSCG